MRISASMQVRLTRKLADFINGIDLSRCRVGDVIDVPLSDARLLVAEGWAQRPVRAEAKDARRPPRKRPIKKPRLD